MLLQTELCSLYIIGRKKYLNYKFLNPLRVLFFYFYHHNKRVVNSNAFVSIEQSIERKTWRIKSLIISLISNEMNESRVPVKLKNYAQQKKE